jgi:hypothetical protein
MPNFFRLVTNSNTDLASAEYDHHHNSGDGSNHHHRHGLFSGHRHHGSSRPSGISSSVEQHQHHHGSHNDSSPRGSSTHNEAENRSGSAQRPAYPEALPSALGQRYTGPVQGTAVLDESVMPLEDAAVLFEMVTPESTPLLKSHVKERFESAIEEAIAHRRQEARERARQEQLQEQEQQVAQQKSASRNNESADGAADSHHVRNNTFSFFKIDNSVTSASQTSSAHRRRRHVLTEGGYVVFTDSYLSAHPNSVVTGVTSELQLAAPDDVSPFHHPATGPDADKKRLQEVKDYIRDVEYEYRPLFRRRTSAMVYGRGHYLRTSSPDLMNGDVYYATSISDGGDKLEREIKKEKGGSKLRKVFSSPLLLN